jgi:hypothetical protein
MAVMSKTLSILLLSCLALPGMLRGQNGDRARSVESAENASWSDSAISYYRRLTLSLNPLGLAEFGPVVGLGAGYQWNAHWQVWLEGSAIFPGRNRNDYPIISGSRVELALKYYYGRRSQWFVGGEFRWKQVFYAEQSTFIRPSNNDIANNVGYTLRNDLPGVAFLTGQRTKAFWHYHVWIEWSVGLGLKYRFVRIEGGPQGYEIIKDVDYRLRPLDLAPEVQRFRVYIPATIRIVYGL